MFISRVIERCYENLPVNNWRTFDHCSMCHRTSICPVGKQVKTRIAIAINYVTVTEPEDPHYCQLKINLGTFANIATWAHEKMSSFLVTHPPAQKYYATNEVNMSLGWPVNLALRAPCRRAAPSAGFTMNRQQSVIDFSAPHVSTIRSVITVAGWLLHRQQQQRRAVINTSAKLFFMNYRHAPICYTRDNHCIMA